MIKLRLMGGNLGWIVPEDLSLFAAVYRKPLEKPNERQQNLLNLIEREGPMTIQQMKAASGLLVKEITPVLHRLQEAFLLYEDQNEGQEDRAWYLFGEMFPGVDVAAVTRLEGVQTLLQRFAYRMVWFDADMAKSYFKVPIKEIKLALAALVEAGVLTQLDADYVLQADVSALQAGESAPPKSVYAMHRNDVLVKAYEHSLKGRYAHTYPDTLYYLLIDGRWCGAAVGKFRYTPEVSDVIVDLTSEHAAQYRDGIVAAITWMSQGVAPERINGVPLK